MVGKMIILSLLFPQLVFADVIWGKVTRVKLEKMSQQFFVTYVEDGKEYAYPLEFSSQSNIEKKLAGMIGQNVKIEGILAMMKTSLDGAIQKIPVFKVRQVMPFSLADLSVKATTMVPFSEQKSQSQNSGGIRMGDTLTNSMIFAGGAILMAKIIGEMLQKGK